MRKIRYDLAGLDKCRLAVKEIRPHQVHRREDHENLCAVVQKAFDLFYETTGYAIFLFESSIGMEYQEALESGATRTKLDCLARECRQFLSWELDRLYESILVTE